MAMDWLFAAEANEAGSASEATRLTEATLYNR